MRDDHALDDLVATLLRLRRKGGPAIYGRAVSAARVAVATAILAEAERRAGVGRPRGQVLRFPMGARGPRGPEQPAK